MSDNRIDSTFEFRDDGIILSCSVDTLSIYHSNEPWMKDIRDTIMSSFHRRMDMYYDKLAISVPRLSTFEKADYLSLIQTFTSEFNSNSDIKTIILETDTCLDLDGKLRNPGRITKLVIKYPHPHSCITMFSDLEELEIHDADNMNLETLFNKPPHSVTSVNLSGKYISKKSLDIVQQVYPNLTSLFIQTNDMEALNSIRNFQGLTELGIFSYELQTLPKDLLKALPYLTSLDMSRTQIGIDTFKLCKEICEEFPNITEFKVPTFSF